MLQIFLRELLPSGDFFSIFSWIWLVAILLLLFVHLMMIILHRGKKPKFEPSAAVQFFFEQRLAASWLRFKIRCLVPAWALCNSIVRLQHKDDLNWRQNWPCVLLGAKYCVVTPACRFMALGYTAKVRGDPEISIGLERIMLHLGPFRSSAIDHELIHCVQDYFVDLFNREAQRTVSLLKWFEYEFFALLTSPLWPVGGLLFCLLPLVIKAFVCYLSP